MNYNEHSRRIIWETFNPKKNNNLKDLVNNKILERICDDIIIELGVNGVPVPTIPLIGRKIDNYGEAYCGKLLKKNFIEKGRGDHCEICGSVKNLTNHHIRKRSEYRHLRYDPNNSMTLCRSCHDVLHFGFNEMLRLGQKER